MKHHSFQFTKTKNDMATQIENNSNNLKITVDGNSRFIMKSQISEVEIAYENIIKIDIGKGALNNVFVDQADVTVPVSTNVIDLRDKILVMLQPVVGSGNATEAKQTEQTLELQAVKVAVTDIKDKMASVNDKLFFEPRISDETNANTIYRGYALTGISGDVAGWAVQWAGGTKDFDKIWNNRKNFIYS
jgi:hypothetical protein